jgi:hypothetical protein
MEHASESKSLRFHMAHPEVWDEFERITLQLIARGFRRYSADGVMHVVRLRTSAGDRSAAFKINNNHVAWYSRRFAEAHPEHADFFKFRERRAA